MNHYLVFLLAFTFGMLALAEAVLILNFHRSIMPLPKRILYWMGTVAVGKEKSRQKFAQALSTKDLRTYAAFASVSGLLVIVSAFIYLFTMI